MAKVREPNARRMGSRCRRQRTVSGGSLGDDDFHILRRDDHRAVIGEVIAVDQREQVDGQLFPCSFVESLESLLQRAIDFAPELEPVARRLSADLSQSRPAGRPKIARELRSRR